MFVISDILLYILSMPSRNIKKVQLPESFYHVYARGSNKQKVFIDNSDYAYFIHLINRYLSKHLEISENGEVYPNFIGKVEIVAYCLMKNHFHLLIYQVDTPFMEKFMRSMMTSYGVYFNLKYKRTGPVFESRYKAVLVDNEKYLQHITRYIHLNPRYWEQYKYSSLKYYLHGNEPHWLVNGKILDLFTSRQDYVDFISDYNETNDDSDALKGLLADK
ncbi:MAG: transposase [Candidatus Saccharibacteria bacterium]